MSQCILIIEDEEDLVAVLKYNLQKSGYEVYHASTGQQGILRCSRIMPDLVLLDINLPDMSGFDICKQLRKDNRFSEVNILMLTAKSEEADRIRGFEEGADDYVTKPFSIRELLLRIQVLLRRKNQPTPSKELVYGVIQLNLLSYQCFISSEEISLTSLEFRLLKQFIEYKEEVQTREVLLKDVWQMDPKVNTRTVDKHVQRLRSKLKAANVYIQTIRGVGYRLRLPET